MKIPIDQVKPSPFSTRPKDMDVMSLTKSIKEHGELQPIKVRPVNSEACATHGWLRASLNMDDVDEVFDCLICHDLGDPQFECVFGHRRLVAARQAGLEDIDCIVEELDDRQARLQMWEENEQREDLDDISRAKFIQQFKNDYGLNNVRTGSYFGISHDLVRTLLGLLEEPIGIQEAIASRQISTRAIAPLRSIIPDQEQRTAVLLEAAEREESSRETIRRAREIAAHEWAGERAEEEIVSQEFYDEIPEKAELLRDIKDFRRTLDHLGSAAWLGQLSREGELFIARRLRSLAAEAIEVAETLEEEP